MSAARRRFAAAPRPKTRRNTSSMRRTACVPAGLRTRVVGRRSRPTCSARLAIDSVAFAASPLRLSLRNSNMRRSHRADDQRQRASHRCHPRRVRSGGLPLSRLRRRLSAVISRPARSIAVSAATSGSVRPAARATSCGAARNRSRVPGSRSTRTRNASKSGELTTVPRVGRPRPSRLVPLQARRAPDRSVPAGRRSAGSTRRIPAAP